MKSEKPKVFIVYGPTGCGKTTKSQDIADFLGCTAIIDEPSDGDLVALDLKYPNQDVLVLSSLARSDFPKFNFGVRFLGFFYICKVAGLDTRKPLHKDNNGKVGEIEILKTYTIHGESESYLPVGNKYPCYLNDAGLAYFVEEDEPGEPCTHFLSDLNEDGINYKFHRA